MSLATSSGPLGSVSGTGEGLPGPASGPVAVVLGCGTVVRCDVERCDDLPPRVNEMIRTTPSNTTAATTAAVATAVVRRPAGAGAGAATGGGVGGGTGGGVGGGAT